MQQNDSLANGYKAPTRTYDEGPYKAADSFCGARCGADKDCEKGACYIPSNRDWGACSFRGGARG